MLALFLLILIVFFLFLILNENEKKDFKKEEQKNFIHEGGKGETPLFNEMSSKEETIARLLGTEENLFLENEEDKTPSLFTLSLSPSASFPALSARAFLIGMSDGSQILFSHNENMRLPIASLTKIMTALVSKESIGKETRLFFLPRKEYYATEDLWYPLFLRSDNSVAENIALYRGEENFIKRMNEYALLKGMFSTSFDDASGLSAKNTSTAFDMHTLAVLLFTEHSDICKISKTQEKTLLSLAGREWRVQNHNLLSSDPYFLCGKLGFTDEARQTALSIFSLPVGKEVFSVDIIILGSEDWKQDTRTLVRWLIRNVDLVALTKEESEEEEKVFEEEKEEV